MDVKCDNCFEGNLLMMPSFYRCENVCDYDICAFCYHLMITEQNEMIEKMPEIIEAKAKKREMDGS
jgi:hypothetical protein